MDQQVGWNLGGAVREGGHFDVKFVREVAKDELLLVRQSHTRLRRFSGHALVGALVDSLNEFNSFFREAHKDNVSLATSTFRAGFNRKLGAWLAMFSSFRAQLERQARELDLPRSSLRASFETVHREHPEYRLTWQLRNLDQHHPPAGDLVTFQSTFDESGGTDYLPMLHLPALFVAAKATAKRLEQWEACEALWDGRPDDVDVREVFGLAYDTCNTLLATFIIEAEPLLVSDVVRIARIWAHAAELSGGHPCLYTEPDGAAGRRTIQYEPLDRLAIGEAMIAINGARQVLGLRPLDVTTDARFTPDA